MSTMTRRLVGLCGACRGVARAVLAVVAAVLVLCGVPATAVARDAIDLDADCSLVVNVPDGVTTTVKVYRVADISVAGDHYTLTGTFANYSVDLNQGNDTPWDDLATTLSGYAARDAIAPTVNGSTAGGSVAFDGLRPGLYLGVVDPAQPGSMRYEFSPFLVQLPGLKTEGGDVWIYRGVTVNPKHSDTPIPPVPGSTIYAVKVWDDAAAVEADSVARPGSVTVQLLRDGSVWASAQLSAANNWRTSWTDLDGGSTWSVVEAEVPDGYTVSVERRGDTFVVTNSAPDPEDPDEPDVPVDPDDPEDPDTPGDPDDPSNPDKPGDSSNPGGGRIPQTSMLWWPVPVLLGVGLALILAGLVRRSRSSE